MDTKQDRYEILEKLRDVAEFGEGGELEEFTIHSSSVDMSNMLNSPFYKDFMNLGKQRLEYYRGALESAETWERTIELKGILFAYREAFNMFPVLLAIATMQESEKE